VKYDAASRYIFARICKQSAQIILYAKVCCWPLSCIPAFRSIRLPSPRHPRRPVRARNIMDTAQAKYTKAKCHTVHVFQMWNNRTDILKPISNMKSLYTLKPYPECLCEVTDEEWLIWYWLIKLTAHIVGGEAVRRITPIVADGPGHLLIDLLYWWNP